MAGFLNVTGKVGNGGTPSSLACPVTIAATKGNTVIGIVESTSGGTVSSVSDTQGGSWTVDVHSVNTACVCSIIRSKLTKSLSTSDSVTVNVTAAGSMAILLCEFEGTYDPADVTANTRSAGTSGTLTASGATSHTPELVVAGVATGGALNQSSFTLSAQTPSNLTKNSEGASSTNYIAIASCLTLSTTTPSATWAWSPSSANWGMAIATYQLSKNSSGRMFRLIN